MNALITGAPCRIALQTWGTDGDIHPFLALAAALAQRGHRVTLAITSAERRSYRTHGERHGFEIVEAGHAAASESEMQRVLERIAAQRNPLRQVGLMFDELLGPGLPEVYRVAQQLCATYDVMVGHFILHPVQAAAERAGIPYLTLTLNHSAIPTRCMAPVGMPDLGERWNGLSWRLSNLICERLIGKRINAWRSRHGFEPRASFRSVWEAPRGNLIAVSPQFCPAPLPPDWGRHQQVCGFFAPMESSAAQELTPEFLAFVGAGPAPVYFSFGSMLAVAQEPQRIVASVRLMCEAAALCGCRAIVQAPWSRLAGLNGIADLPPQADLLRVERAPHHLAFAHCAAVVHHGGAGTTQTVALSGRPSVVVAHFGDQFFWGRELARLGIAPACLDRRKLTARKLARILRSTLDDQGMPARARQIGAQLAQEDGLARAVELIERTLLGIELDAAAA